METHAGYFDAGEVLNPFDRDRETNFHYWLEARADALLYAMGLTHDSARVMAEAFTNYVLSFADRVILDVKYNNFGALDPSFFFRSEAPMFLSYWMERRLPIVRLKRKDLFRVYVSDQIKAAKNVNHAFLRGNGDGLAISDNQGLLIAESDVDSAASVVVDASAGLNYMRLVRREEALFDEFLLGYERLVDLEYEDNVLQEEPRQLLNEALGLSIREGAETWMRRVPLDYPNLIANRDEILNFFRDTEFRAGVEGFFSGLSATPH
jgi:hypothetical protein